MTIYFQNLKILLNNKNKKKIKQVHTLISVDLNIIDVSLQCNDLLLHSEIIYSENKIFVNLL